MFSQRQNVTDERAVAGGGQIVVPAMGAAKLSLFGLLSLVIVAGGVWAGLLPYVGPLFGLGLGNAGAWQWDTNRALLDLLPGAVAVFGGLMLLASLAALSHGRGRFLAGVGALLALLSGAWLVLGPSIYGAATGAELAMPKAGTWSGFVLDFAYHLGPGLLLVACGAWTWGMLPHSAMRRHLVTD